MIALFMYLSVGLRARINVADSASGLGLGFLGGFSIVAERLFDGFFGAAVTREYRIEQLKPKPDLGTGALSADQTRW